MFGRHHQGRQRGVHSREPFGFHGRHEHGPEGRGHEGRSHEGRGRGGRSGRFFDHGDLRLVVLKLIADKPSHGYELIKAIETAAGGAYAPSPGVIYPTLTLLEETGYATQTETGGGKKLYTATPEGLDHLAANDPAVKTIFGRMETSAAGSQAFSPQILRARENLKTALRLKLMTGALTPEQVAAIARAMDAAAVAIEQA
jgi:DNA-binding PadR family transcriptional regulator